MGEDTILLLKLGLIFVQDLNLLRQVDILGKQLLVGGNVFIILTFQELDLIL